MVAHIALEATKRVVTGKKVKNLRSEGIIPAVVYGHGFESEKIQLVAGVLEKVYKQAGYSHIITLAVDGEKYDALFHEVLMNPVTGAIAHVDFTRIRKGEKITTSVPVEITGESSAVKELGGVLLRELQEIEIRCLPQDLIENITVDISSIVEFNEPIRVKDLKVPSMVEVLSDEDGVVVTVAAPKQEKEEVAEGAASLIPEELKKQQEADAAAAKAASGDKEKKEKKE